MQDKSTYDVIIVGGSYAGLSAAMTLGRSDRNVLIIDSGKPCNRQTPYAHNLITHDGDKPADIARKAIEQVLAYPTVWLMSGKVTALSGNNGSFEISTDNEGKFNTRKVILATGVKDIPMQIEGFAACWGISVLHCPYCHGYEVADEALGIIANGDMAFEMCRLIHNWSKNLTLFTNGPANLSAEQRTKLTMHGISIADNPIWAVEHEQGRLHHIAFTDGSKHPVKAIFARGGIEQPGNISKNIGCEINAEGMSSGLIKVDDFGRTTVPGIYAAGDNCSPMRALAAAMASGMKAAAILNHELIAEDF